MMFEISNKTTLARFMIKAKYFMKTMLDIKSTSQNVKSQVRHTNNWAASSEFVSSSIPSWQILTAHAQPFRGARDLAFCLKVPLDSLLVWASSGGSGETARMRRLAWTFAARIGDKYQIRSTRPNLSSNDLNYDKARLFAKFTFGGVEGGGGETVESPAITVI